MTKFSITQTQQQPTQGAVGSPTTQSPPPSPNVPTDQALHDLENEMTREQFNAAAKKLAERWKARQGKS